MWISSTAQQAIQAVLCIAKSTDDGPVRVDEIAVALKYPRNYLSKTLHHLARAGVLGSERGSKGGFRLAIVPEKLTLERVIAPFKLVGKRQCLVGLPHCDGANPCALHDRWGGVVDEVNRIFTETTIANLLDDNHDATVEMHAVIQSVRATTRRKSHGSNA